MHQHGFQIVLGMMGSGDFCVRRQGSEKVISQNACGFLRANSVRCGIGSNVALSPKQGNVQTAAMRRDKIRISLRLCAAELVVKVRGRDGNGQRILELQHQMQQRHGILASGNRTDHMISGRNHMVAADEIKNVTVHCASTPGQRRWCTGVATGALRCLFRHDGSLPQCILPRSFLRYLDYNSRHDRETEPRRRPAQ